MKGFQKWETCMVLMNRGPDEMSGGSQEASSLRFPWSRNRLKDATSVSYGQDIAAVRSGSSQTSKMLVPTVVISGIGTWGWAWICMANWGWAPDICATDAYFYFGLHAAAWSSALKAVPVPGVLGKLLQGSFSFKFIMENFSYTKIPETGPPLFKLSKEYASLKWVLHNNDAWDPAVGYSQIFLNCL